MPVNRLLKGINFNYFTCFQHSRKLKFMQLLKSEERWGVMEKASFNSDFIDEFSS
jgi:hypothetical protein